jgi:very-short-patch-repair endonuclease
MPFQAELLPAADILLRYLCHFDAAKVDLIGPDPSQLNGHRFTKQFQVGSYFVDFVCREKKLVVEVDGWSHDARQGYDCQRDKFIRSKGYEVLRFTNEQVMLNLEGVLAMIRERLAAIPSPNPSRAREGS